MPYEASRPQLLDNEIRLAHPGHSLLLGDRHPSVYMGIGTGDFIAEGYSLILNSKCISRETLRGFHPSMLDFLSTRTKIGLRP